MMQIEISPMAAEIIRHGCDRHDTVPGQPCTDYGPCEDLVLDYCDGDTTDASSLWQELQAFAERQGTPEELTEDEVADRLGPQPMDDPEHARAVERQVERLKVNRDAKAILDAEGAPEVPDPVTLTDFLDQPDEEVAFLIDGLWPAGESVLWTGPRKAGKTTGRDNLLRALVDGGQLFGRYPVRERGSRVAVLDFELSESLLRPWLSKLHVEHTDKVDLYPMKGKVRAFDLRIEKTMAAWAERLADVDVVLVDCLRPWVDALGLDENRDLSMLMHLLDEVCQRARPGNDAPVWVALHHTGHGGERSRGDSGSEGTAGVLWRTVMDNVNDMASARYFSAFGRDVEVKESKLAFDPNDRTLTIVGGSRAAEKGKKPDKVHAALSALFADRQGRIDAGEDFSPAAPIHWTTNQAAEVVGSVPGLKDKRTAVSAIKQATKDAYLIRSKGATNRAILYAFSDAGIALVDRRGHAPEND